LSPSQDQIEENWERDAMSKVIEKLQKEHFRLGRLVCLLNEQANLRTDATAPNIALLVDALCYLTRFPDVTHHMLEDRMVEKLLAKKALSVEVGHEIEAQHLRLIRDGRDLLRDLEAATRGENMSQELVDIRVRLYAERLRHNMVIEELTLFPAAEASLNDEDWHAIEDIAPHGQSDPLFDGEVDEQFVQLYRVINDEATTAHAGAPFCAGL
jgi:hemerythrin-like domain-containing protein